MWNFKEYFWKHIKYFSQIFFILTIGIWFFGLSWLVRMRWMKAVSILKQNDDKSFCSEIMKISCVLMLTPHNRRHLTIWWCYEQAINYNIIIMEEDPAASNKQTLFSSFYVSDVALFCCFYIVTFNLLLTVL